MLSESPAPHFTAEVEEGGTGACLPCFTGVQDGMCGQTGKGFLPHVTLNVSAVTLLISGTSTGTCPHTCALSLLPISALCPSVGKGPGAHQHSV